MTTGVQPADRTAVEAARARVTNRLARAPIATRLTAAFAVSMALLLGGTFAVVYVRQSHALDLAIDHDLRLRAAEIVEQAAVASAHGHGGSEAETARALLGGADGSLQVYGSHGELLASTPRFAHHRIVSRGELARDAVGTHLASHSVHGVSSERRHVRVLVRDIPGRGMHVVLAAGTASRTEALEALLEQLLVALAAALVTGSIVAWALARRALLPVERLRQNAARLADSDSRELLPVPPADDEIARLATTLNALVAQLHDTVARERQFVADAGHELRTPLTLLSAEIEYALDQPRDAAGYRGTLASLREETDRLARLCENLLFLATDHASAADGHSDVAIVANRVADRVRPKLTAAGRSLDVDVPPDVLVQCDADALQQLLLNLVDNAAGHGAGTVTVSCVVVGSDATLRVHDEGGGVPANFAVRAFDRFARADPARSGRGSGLGLAIVATIARACGGTVAVVDGDVCVDLPVAA